MQSILDWVNPTNVACIVGGVVTWECSGFVACSVVDGVVTRKGYGSIVCTVGIVVAWEGGGFVCCTTVGGVVTREGCSSIACIVGGVVTLVGGRAVVRTIGCNHVFASASFWLLQDLQVV